MVLHNKLFHGASLPFISIFNVLKRKGYIDNKNFISLKSFAYSVHNLTGNPNNHFNKMAASSLSNPSIEIIRDKTEKFGAPDRIRICDLCLRRAALYPAELRVLKTEQ